MNSRDVEEFDSGYGESSQYAAHLDRGWALLDRGDLAAARTSVSHAQDVRPDDPDACVLQGAIALAEGKPEESLRCYERALELDPEYLEPYAAAAQICLFDLDDPARGLHFCTEALELDALDAVESVDLILLASECELAQEHIAAATRRLDDCTGLQVVDLALQLAAGVWQANETQGDPDKQAAADYLGLDHDGQPLDEEDQKDRLARMFQLAMRTARLRLDIGDLPKAVGELERLTGWFPNEADAWYLVGEAYLRSNDVRRGASASLRTLELDAQLELPSWVPTPPEIHRRIADALQEIDIPGAREAVNATTPIALLIQDRPAPELVAEGVDPRMLAMGLGSKPSEGDVVDPPLVLTAVSVYRANIARLCKDAGQFDEELRLAVLEELEAFFAPLVPSTEAEDAPGEAASDGPAETTGDDAADKPRRRKRRRSRKKVVPS